MPSKYIKVPKEPKTFKRPRAYMREYFGYDLGIVRIRIIYPDGKAEWGTAKFDAFGKSKKTCWEPYVPCWHEDGFCSLGRVRKSSMSAEEAVKAMKEYDRDCGYKTIYLGEF